MPSNFTNFRGKIHVNVSLTIAGGVAIALAKTALVAAPLLFASTVANAGRDTTLTLNGNQQWNNFELSVTVNPIAGWNESRIFLQTNNFNVSSDGQAGSGYSINLARVSGAPIGPDELHTLPSQINWIDLYRIDCTGPGLCSDSGKLVKHSEFSPAFDNPTHVTAVDNNGHIQVLLNGKSFLDYTDPNPLPAGSIGLGSIWETKATFANLVVSSGGNILFQDHFNDSSSLNNYTITSGKARIEGNHLITGPVPEPEEWAMMLLGFGMVGYQARRKQRKSASDLA